MSTSAFLGKKRRIRANRSTDNAEVWEAVNIANHRIKEVEEALAKVRNILNKKQLSAVTGYERKQLTEEINKVLSANSG
jgi:hypothetical protein